MKKEKLKKFSAELSNDVEKLLINELASVRGGLAATDPCPACKTACQPGCMGAAINGNAE